MGTIKVGVKRNGLILHRKLREGTRVTKFECECSFCGKMTTIKSNKFGYIQSCGCLKRRLGANNPRFEGAGKIHKAKWNTYTRNAETRNIPFNITVEDGWKLFEQQNGKCALTGEDLNFWKSGKVEDKHCTASLDRIDNTKGYTLKNCHWVHKKINQIKMDLSTREFIDWCKKVVKYDDNN